MSTHDMNLTAHIATLADGLSGASEMAWDAYQAGRIGEINQAIGTLMPVAEQLETYAALCKTILALHRIGKGSAA